MFRDNVIAWLTDKDEYVVNYINVMLLAGKDSLTDFENEITLVEQRMLEVEKYGVEFMFFWSIRTYLEEVVLYC
jgi:hypothetical protein